MNRAFAGEPVDPRRARRSHHSEPVAGHAEREAGLVGHLHVRRAQHRGRRRQQPYDSQRQM